ncbi:bifunctional diguanylate cyclase/phosphodiesterase [Ectothiorhodospiraceae bacterium 2226]|nr:bifunctional diguanylate cyclase/phosphodiesterase [Ectothiorhodospiraceae bacterium 2226]
MGGAKQRPARRRFSCTRERERLQEALLDATAALAREADTPAVCQRMCDTLVQTSRHIVGAWFYRLERETGEIVDRIIYGAGDYPEGEIRARDFAEVLGALEADVSAARTTDACFMLGASFRGCLGIRVDRQRYLELIALEPLYQFAQVAGALLDQAYLRARLRHLVEHDDLTGLLNRRGVRQVLEHVEAQALRAGEPYALVLLDLDNFKLINDRHGHGAGDRVLKDASQALAAGVRQGDWVGRWGGEEFIAVLPGAEVDEAMDVADRILRRIRAISPIISGQRLRTSASAGVACHPLDGTVVDELLGVADAALYEAKARGRDRALRATQGSRRTYTLAGRIERALRRDLLQPAYQPIVDLNSGAVVGQELLARLLPADDEEGLTAAEFIGAASKRHLVHLIDRRMFLVAIEHLLQWQTEAPAPVHFVNLSAGLLRKPRLIRELVAAVEGARTEFPTCKGCLVIEVTERDFIDPSEARDMLAPFVDLGVRLALDDFGSGYSSFQYLSDLPIDYLKIEGGLVRAASGNAKDRAIVKGIRDIARELGISTLAEGIEDEATAELMQDLEIDLAQGFYFGRPALEVDGSSAIRQRPR